MLSVWPGWVMVTSGRGSYHRLLATPRDRTLERDEMIWLDMACRVESLLDAVFGCNTTTRRARFVRLHRHFPLRKLPANNRRGFRRFMHHRSLLECFESMQPTGCGSCQEEARAAAKLIKEGKTLADIRAEFDRRWGS